MSQEKYELFYASTFRPVVRLDGSVGITALRQDKPTVFEVACDQRSPFYTLLLAAPAMFQALKMVQGYSDLLLTANVDQLSEVLNKQGDLIERVLAFAMTGEMLTPTPFVPK